VFKTMPGANPALHADIQTAEFRYSKKKGQENH
jgi:hypothetical protein